MHKSQRRTSGPELEDKNQSERPHRNEFHDLRRRMLTDVGRNISFKWIILHIILFYMLMCASIYIFYIVRIHENNLFNYKVFQ